MTLRDDIRSALGEPRAVGGGLEAAWAVPGSFGGFHGHFPGRPVLPGVCLVQAGLALFEAHRAARARLQCLESAKFTQPIPPGTALRLAGRAEPAGAGRERLRVRAWAGERKAAELSLLVTFEPP